MTDVDVLIIGAGPAGVVAGVVLARAGVRVRIVDRATFPREKLCGDTVNPGTLARLRHLGLAEVIDRQGLRVEGMLVTGERGAGAGNVVIDGAYPDGLVGGSLSRSALDWALLQEAMKAGAAFEAGVAVRGALVTETRKGASVAGVSVGGRGAVSMRAGVTIAADGRRSTLAWGLGLAHHPRRPRRWAVGAYFEGVGAPASRARVLGEMHIRRGRYIGVAPLPGGMTNVCLVRSIAASARRGSGAAGGSDSRGSGAYDRDAGSGDPLTLLKRELERDADLRDRFAGARLVRPPVVLGPLAVDVVDRGIDGLILAGDAAGFIDPMTGDGLRFAVRGGELAAAAALRALEHGWTGVHEGLAETRRREFATKWRFNRALRALVASPTAVHLAAAGARLSPALMQAIIARAGDCHLVERMTVAADHAEAVI